jgi:hypothetical protein
MTAVETADAIDTGQVQIDNSVVAMNMADMVGTSVRQPLVFSGQEVVVRGEAVQVCGEAVRAAGGDGGDGGDDTQVWALWKPAKVETDMLPSKPLYHMAPRRRMTHYNSAINNTNSASASGASAYSSTSITAPAPPAPAPAPAPPAPAPPAPALPKANTSATTTSAASACPHGTPLQHVGRLDQNTTGLLLFTNHGMLNRLLCLSPNTPKTYIASMCKPLNQPPTREQLGRMIEGLDLKVVVTVVVRVEVNRLYNENE